MRRMDPDVSLGLKALGLFSAGLAIALIIRRYRLNVKQTFNMITNGTYFTVDELCHSDTAAALGIANIPSSAARDNIQMLITKILNPVRERYGSPIRITSGFRCPTLNAKVGGATSSQHLTGQAADLVGQNGTVGELKNIFQACLDVGGYDQLIIERKGNSRWVHVSWRSAGARGQILNYKDGVYTSVSKSNWENYLYA